MDVQPVPLEQQVESLTRRLLDDYAGQVPDQVVRGLVDEAFSVYRHAKVQQFVPVLVARSVRQRLAHQALAVSPAAHVAG